MSTLKSLLEEEKGIFIDFDMFNEMKEALRETFASGSLTIIAIMARRCGESVFNKIIKEKPMKKKKALDYLCEIINQKNWGQLSFVKIDLKKGHGKAIVKNSFEARNCRSTGPCCHFLSNFMAGFLSKLLKREVNVTEIECAGKGAAFCEFEF